jgi:carboxyl-terminal processing protease
VKNVGQGTSEETVANLRNLSGPGLLLHAGRFQIGEMKPGAEQTVAFTFEVLPEFAETAAKLEVSVGDSVLRESVGEKLQLPVRQDPPTSFSTTTGTVALGQEGLVYERPSDDARVVARARGGVVELNAQAVVGNFTRVDLGDGRPGWVKKAQLAQKATAGGKGKLEDVLAHMPPKLEVSYGNALVTQQDFLKVKGSAVDDTRVRDVYIFVGSRKIFYQSNRNAQDPTTQKFEAALPLRPGINFVTVVARENNDVASHKSFIVRRDGVNGTLLETPKADEEDDMFHSSGGEQ